MKKMFLNQIKTHGKEAKVESPSQKPLDKETKIESQDQKAMQIDENGIAISKIPLAGCPSGDNRVWC